MSAKSTASAVVKIDDETWERLHAAVNSFEECWRTSHDPPEIATFLSEEDDAAQNPTLLELIKVDQEYRWRRGRPKPLEDYLEQWPGLRSCASAVEELLWAECATRAAFGAEASEDELRRRFPEVSKNVDLARIASEAGDDRERPNVADTSRQRLASTLPIPPAIVVLKAGAVFGRYQIKETIGQGGMGTVYRAFDTHLKREVALKIPRLDHGTDRAVSERFLREAQAAAGIEQTNVCTIFDAGEVDGAQYITMKYVDGPSLDEWIAEVKTGPRRAAEILAKLAKALAKVHDRGIVHGDIKPSNVLMDDDEPLLTDFGLATPLENNALDANPSFLGTIPYMSPQQLAGESADRSSDIYSLGAVFYQLLTRQLPFTGTMTEMMVKIATEEPAQPSQLNEAIDAQLESICLRAVAREPSDRFQSAHELGAALDEYLENTTRVNRSNCKRRWLRPISAFVAATALLALGIIVNIKTDEGTISLDLPSGSSVKIAGKAIDVYVPKDLKVGRQNREILGSIYATDFFSDPGWTTNNPRRHKWIETGSYLITMENKNGGGDFSYYDVGHPFTSFRLEFDVLVRAIDPSSGVYIGLFDEDMNAVDEGSNAYVSFNSSGEGLVIGLEFEDTTMRCDTTAAKQYPLNTWLHVRMDYSAVQRKLTANVTSKKKEASFAATLSLTDAGPFGLDMTRIGASNLRRDVHREPGNRATAEIDNVQFFPGPLSAYRWHAFDGHWYALTRDYGTWEEAEAEANALGGHLVTIDSEAKNKWLARTFRGSYTRGFEDSIPGDQQALSDPKWMSLVWIGYHYSNGAWRWSSGNVTRYEPSVWDERWLKPSARYKTIHAYLHTEPHERAGTWWNSAGQTKRPARHPKGVIELRSKP